MSVDDVEGGWRLGSWKGSKARRRIVMPWADLVTFALGFWEQEEVEAALGDDLAEAIPELCCLTDLQVRMPRMEVVALERLAAREGSRLMRSSRGSCAISCRRNLSGW